MQHHPNSWYNVVRVAWPFILSNSVWLVQVSLDRVFLGWSGIEGAVGAAMAGALIYWAPFVLFHGTAGYASTFVAQYVGAGEEKRVGAAVWQAIYLSLCGGLLFLFLWPSAHTIVTLVGHPVAIQHLETTYLQTLSLAALPILLSMSLSSFFAGRGQSQVVLWINGVGFLANAALDYAWIFGNWGFPALGIRGAGLATAVGSSLSASLALVLFLLPENRRRFCTFSSWRFDLPLFKRFLRFGFPNGVFVAFDVLAFSLFTLIVGRFGQVALDATTIAFTWNMMAFVPGIGIGQAVGVLVGQHLGENRPDRAEEATKIGLLLASTGTALIGIVFVVVPGPLIEVFHNPSLPDAKWGETHAVAVVLLRFVVVYCLFDNFNILLSSALRGAGDTKFVSIVALSLSWPIMVIPTWASWYFGWGLYSAWTFSSLYIVLLAGTFFWRFRQGKWREMRVIEQPPTENLLCDQTTAPTTNFAH